MSLLRPNKSRVTFINIMLMIFLVIFLYMIRNYIVVLILALIFAALLTPVYNRLSVRLKNKKSLSAAIVTLAFLLMVAIPGLFLIEEIMRQAVGVTESIIPYIEGQIESDSASQTLPDWVPFRDVLLPYTAQIFDKINSSLGGIVNSIVTGLSHFTQNTAVFFLNFFIMIYAIYGFIRNGSEMVAAARKYLPISTKQFDILSKEIIEVSRATLKGAIVIGVIQGSLVGLSFWVAGLDAPLFWGAVAAFASLIPGVGAALVYIPGAIYLFVTGHTTGGVGVLLWGLLVVGSVDNILRPMLVGKDMQMSDVMVLVSTLGGIGVFGIAGIVLGPLVVGLLQVFISFSHQESQ